MSNNNGNRTGGETPTWVTHATEAYPPGPHPARPAPLPAPFWAEETRTMPTEPAPVAPSGWRRWLVPAVTAAVVAAAGLAGGYVIGSATPASCVEALEYADELNAQSEQYGVLVGEAFDAVAAFDQAAADAAVAEVQALSVEHDATYAAYETAAESCRAAGGAL
jgi:hypothetical protein